MSKNKEEKFSDESEFPILELWSKYEQIAMHFNELLMKLRTQALATVAALSTVVSVLVKGGEEGSLDWNLAGTAFLVLAFFWVAIWCLDFLYYNRLLIGAVEALHQIEEASLISSKYNKINMSISITQSVGSVLKISNNTYGSYCSLSRGRWFFYIIVFIVLIGLSIYSFCK